MFIYVCPMLLLFDFFVFLMVMHCYDGYLSDFFLYFFLVFGFFFFNQAGVLCYVIFIILKKMFQFCNAGIEYGESSCGVLSSSSKILIKGGIVVNAHREEVNDVYVKDGIIVVVKPNIKVLSSYFFFKLLWLCN